MADKSTLRQIGDVVINVNQIVSIAPMGEMPLERTRERWIIKLSNDDTAIISAPNDWGIMGWLDDGSFPPRLEHYYHHKFVT